MEDPHPSSIINHQSSIPRALHALEALGFTDAGRVVEAQGASRVLAAAAYVESRRNIRRPGVYVRRLLQNGRAIPAPLVWPDEQGGWQDWRSLNGRKPLSGKYRRFVHH